MHSSKLQISFANPSGQPKDFTKDTSSDLLIMFNQFLIPVQRKILAHKSYYVDNQIELDEKVHAIQSDLCPKAITQILGCFYGLPLYCPRNECMIDVLAVVEFLGIQELENVIYRDLTENIKFYDFFVIMRIADRFNMEEIIFSCWVELKKENYEQMNYNRHAFLCCERSLFIQVVQQFVKDCFILGKRRFVFIQQYVKNLLLEYNSCKQDAIEIGEIIYDIQYYSNLKDIYQSSNIKEIINFEGNQLCVGNRQFLDVDNSCAWKDDESTQPSPVGVYLNESFSSMEKNFFMKVDQEGEAELPNSIRVIQESDHESEDDCFADPQIIESLQFDAQA